MMRNQLFNRKVLFSLLAVVMCLGFTAMSYGQVVVSVEPAEVESPAAGEELMVSINITGGAGVAGYQVTVNFDATALSYDSIAYNDDYIAEPPALLGGVEASDNSVRFLGLGDAPDGDHTLATITFTVVEAKASTISLADVLVSGAGGVALESTTMDSMVTIAAAEEPAAEEPAAEEAPAEEGAEEPAAEETPAEEVPAEEVPAEETPAEEVVPEMPTSQMFEITLTNLTMGEAGMGGQVLSHPIFVTHAAGINLAPVGEAASEALVLLAENGDVAGLVALATAAGANSMVAERGCSSRWIGYCYCDG